MAHKLPLLLLLLLRRGLWAWLGTVHFGSSCKLGSCRALPIGFIWLRRRRQHVTLQQQPRWQMPQNFCKSVRDWWMSMSALHATKIDVEKCLEEYSLAWKLIFLCDEYDLICVPDSLSLSLAYLSLSLCLSTRLTLCLSVCLFIYQSIFLFALLSLCLSACLSTCLPLCLPYGLSACLSVCLSIQLSVYLSVYSPVSLPVCLSVCSSDCLSICSPVSLSAALSICPSVCSSAYLPTRLPACLSLCLYERLDLSYYKS